MSGVPYIRFFPDDWLSGTNELSPAEKGVLITIVALTASTGFAPRNDPDRLSRRFGCTKGSARKILAALVELGKVSIVDGKIKNARAIEELKKSKENSKKQSEKSLNRWQKNEEKSNKNKADDDTAAKPRQSQPEPEPYIDNVEKTGRDVKAIRDVCIRAASPCIKQIKIPYIPIRPILLLLDDAEYPCDLEGDVLPALRDVAARASPDIANTFNFFKDEIIKYRDARLAGNPKPTEMKNDRPNQHRKPRPSPTDTIRDTRRKVWGSVLDECENEGLAKKVRKPSGLRNSQTA